MSAVEVSKKLYEDGLKKLEEINYMSTTKDISKYDKNYSFKPKISKKSL